MQYVWLSLQCVDGNTTEFWAGGPVKAVCVKFNFAASSQYTGEAMAL